jgi:hypothetical protein
MSTPSEDSSENGHGSPLAEDRSIDAANDEESDSDFSEVQAADADADATSTDFRHAQESVAERPN